MDKELFDAVQEHVPKFNKTIAEGITSSHMKSVESYLDSIWRSIAASFREGLTYEGYERCTPEEEFVLNTCRFKSTNFYELSRTDTYMVRYKLRFVDPKTGNVTEFAPHMELPFVGKGGQLYIGGSMFTISPVLADPVFSASHSELFLSLVKSKENFHRHCYHFTIDGDRRTTSVVWANLHNKGKTSRGGSRRAGQFANPDSTLIHYMFARFGVTETMARFGAEVKVGYVEDFEDLDREVWSVCTTIGICPTTAVRKGYRPTKVAMAVRKNDLTNPVVCAIGGFFYIVDHFPERIKPQDIDECRQWQILLGHAIFADSEAGEGVLFEKVDRHIASLDEYIDAVSKKMLAEVGVAADDVYDLFVDIIENMQQRMLKAEPTSMYGKRFMVLQYALLEITKSISNFMFGMQRINKPHLTADDVKKMIWQNLKPNAVTSNRNKHGELNPVASPCDNMLFEHNIKVIPQTMATRGSSHGFDINDPSRLLHASIAEVGSYGNQPKSEPTGRSAINLYLNVASDGSVERNPIFKELLDNIQASIRR